jgi:putative ABC transport system substrate-binding protein
MAAMLGETSGHWRAASPVDKLLQGADPAQLPLDLATSFEFVVNVKALRAIDITIPPDVAVRVTEWVPAP